MNIDNLPGRYSAGAASVEAGGTVVTPKDAAWYGNVWGEDLFFLPSQPLFPPQRIEQANPDGTLTLAYPWPGAAAVEEPYEVRFVGIIERSTAQSRRVLEQLGDVKAWYDVIVVDDASRLALETASSPLRAGYRVLVKDGGVIWAKKTSAFGDWIGPVEFKGDTGQKGWSPVHGIVTDGARRVWRLVEWVGGQGAPPPGAGKYVGPSGLVDDIAAATDVRGPAGQDGTGTGDMVGPANSADDEIVLFSGITGKHTKRSGKTIADLQPVGAVRYDQAQSLTLQEQGRAQLNLGANRLAGRREKLTNGRLLVNQKAVFSGTIIAGGVQEVADLWRVSNATNAPLTWSVAPSQSFGRNRDENRLTLTYASAPSSGDLYIQHRIEGVNAFADTTVTSRVDALDVGLLAAAPLSIFLIQNFGAGGSPQVVLPTVATTETGAGPRRAVIPVPSTAGKTIGAGSYIEQRWAFSPRAAGTMTVAAFSLVEGDARLEPSAPAGPSYGDELAECQRQFVRLTGMPTGTRFASGLGVGANNSAYTIPFQMRVLPAMSFSGMTVAVASTAPAVTAISAVSMASSGINVSVTAPTTPADTLCQLRSNGVNDYIDFYAGLF